VHDELAGVYDKVASLLGCRASEVALVDSATTAWTRLFFAFARYLEIRREEPLRRGGRKERVIYVSQVEYAANLVAACQFVKDRSRRGSAAGRAGEVGGGGEGPWTVKVLPSRGSTGKVDPGALERILTGRDASADPASVAIVCVTHVPTNSGLVNPVEEVGRIIERYNLRHRSSSLSEASAPSSGGPPPVLYLVDACQSVGQLPVSVRECACHGLVGTGRKWLRGPRGTGFLYCAQSLLVGSGVGGDGELWPDPADHFGAPVERVPAPLPAGSSVEGMLELKVREGARRFEFWESSVANRLGLGVAVQAALCEGLDSIRERILERATYLHRELSTIPRVRTLYPPECGIVSFWVEGDHGDRDEASRRSDRLRDRLWERGFEVVVSPATSTPLDSSVTGAPDAVRVSTSYTNTTKEIDAFLSGLRSLLELPEV
jgi:selenocysteine lyase/cysteine desulfurase